MKDVVYIARDVFSPVSMLLFFVVVFYGLYVCIIKKRLKKRQLAHIDLNSTHIQLYSPGMCTTITFYTVWLQQRLTFARSNELLISLQNRGSLPCSKLVP